MPKVWGGTMMVRKTGKQHRVIMLGTIKAFREASGIGRDYMSDTGNAIELAAATNLGVLLIQTEPDYPVFVPFDEFVKGVSDAS